MKRINLCFLLFFFLLPGEVLAACIVSSISLNDSKSDSWDSSCTSTHRSGAYAQYYTFTLSSSQEITIDLTSSKDTYLFLLNGSGENGSVIAQDDDGGNGRNSQITRTLSAGNYTIEATTYESATTGSFVVSLSGSVSSDCIDSISFDDSISDSWDSDCTSTHRSGAYARYYTFTLSSTRQVTIDLTSSKDTYLFLLNGSGENGGVIEQNDDGGSGRNSRITRTLSAGDYTIEATTYEPATTGSFVVSLTCGDCPFAMNAGLNGNWWGGSGRNGEGVQFEISRDEDGKLILIATVYSYDTLGNQIFLIAVGEVIGDSADVDVFITEDGLWGQDFDPALVKETQWGTGTFTAGSCSLIKMELNPNATYKGMGYTDLMYDLSRLTTTQIVPCPFDIPN